MSHVNFNKAQFVVSYGEAHQLPSARLPEVVFCGRSNVGKSSLINALCSRTKLAKTSQKPGKTATINFFEADGIYLVDLPGYGYASVSKSERARWSRLIDGYFAQNRSFNLVVCLIDVRHEPTALDREMLGFLVAEGLPICVALTKCDKVSRRRVDEAKREVARVLSEAATGNDPAQEPRIITTSSKDKRGMEELERAIETATLEE